MLQQTFLIVFSSCCFSNAEISKNLPIETSLHEKLMSNYNPLVRPVINYTDRLYVYARFSLLRIVDLNIKDQVLSLDVNIEHEWKDSKLNWDPEQYGGIRQIGLLASAIWKPDVALYNGFAESGMYLSDGESAVITHEGRVQWTSHTIIKTFCPIEIQYYPFDIQNCNITIASWSHSGSEIYLTFKNLPDDMILPVGMDLSEFIPSSEWDIIVLRGEFEERYFNCCVDPYLTIRFDMTFRRHSQFYLMNMVMPLAGISYLSQLVFYLPVDSGEKITLCVSVFTAQVTFLLLMMDNIPVTSLAVPLLGKLIIFNMLLVFISILCTVIVLNLYFRKSETHPMPACLDKLLNSDYLQNMLSDHRVHKTMSSTQIDDTEMAPKFEETQSLISFRNMEATNTKLSARGPFITNEPEDFKRVIYNVKRIRDYMEYAQESEKASDGWKLAAELLDRIFLVVFNIFFFVGTGYLLSNAPALYDESDPLGRRAA